MLFVVVTAAAVITTARVSNGEHRLLLGMMLAGPLCAGVAALARTRIVEPTRPVWQMLCASMLATAAATTATGEIALQPTGSTATLSKVLWLIAYGTGFRGFVLLVLVRLGRLQRTTWLDGVVGAVVIQAVLTWLLLMPSDVDMSGASLTSLLFPFGDVVCVGLFLAAAAQGGWRLTGWSSFILGAVLISVADGTVAARAFGAQNRLYEFGVLGWPLGYGCFAYGAWARVALPQPFPNGRPGVPVTFGAIAAALIGLAGLTDARVASVSTGLAVLGLAGVLVRFGVTLRENDNMIRATQQQALSDPLTALPNRRRLERDLANAIALALPTSPVALGLYDLDGFKRYNDTFGHQAGDELLATIGARLAAAVTPRGTAYRLGGDEFCVLLHNAADDADAFMATAAAALASHITGFPVVPSFGTVLIPAEASDVETALKLADQRMYRHKASKADRSVRPDRIRDPLHG